jgi:hypothetical protein
MFKSRKGSITVIALVMLLFLVVLAGAWVMMMTQERTNAYGDEKQQQAYYAAEAGYKRAALLLTHGYADWSSIITTNSNLKIAEGYKNDKWKLNTEGLKRVDGTTVDDANDKTDATGGPWYAFSIVNSTDKADVTAAASTGTYTITSMGYYMGELKTVTHDVKITGSGSGGGSGISASSYTGIAQAGQNIIVANATSSISDGANKNKASLFANTVTDYTGGGINRPWGVVASGQRNGGAYTKDFITHLPIDTFFDLAKYTTSSNYAGKIEYSDQAILKAGKIYSMDLKYAYYYYQQIDATAANDATLVLYNSNTDSSWGILRVATLAGPTSGKPLNIVSLLGSSSNIQAIYNNAPYDAGVWNVIPTLTEANAGISFKGDYTGRIRVISNGSIYLENDSNWGPIPPPQYNVGDGTKNAFMFLSNGWIMEHGYINAPAYLSSNYVGTATYDYSNFWGQDFSIYLTKTFYGEVVTPGSIYIATPIHYDNSVLADNDFPAPDGITVWNSK